MTKKFKQTDFVDLVAPKRPRGRPATGCALTGAERQRLHRDKLRGDTPKRPRGRPAVLKLDFNESDLLRCQIDDLKKQVADLQSQLSKRGKK